MRVVLEVLEGYKGPQARMSSLHVLWPESYRLGLESTRSQQQYQSRKVLEMWVRVQAKF